MLFTEARLEWSFFISEGYGKTKPQNEILINLTYRDKPSFSRWYGWGIFSLIKNGLLQSCKHYLLEETVLTCNIKLQHFMSALFLHPVCMIMVLRSSVTFCRYLMVTLLQQWFLCGFLKSNSLKSCRPCLQYPKFITMNICVTQDKIHSFFKLLQIW